MVHTKGTPELGGCSTASGAIGPAAKGKRSCLSTTGTPTSTAAAEAGEEGSAGAKGS